MKRRTLIQILGASVSPALLVADAACCSASTAGLIVPFPAGGGADVLARSIADAFGRELGLTFGQLTIQGLAGRLAPSICRVSIPTADTSDTSPTAFSALIRSFTQKHLLTLWRHLSQWDESLRLVSLQCSILTPLKV